MGVSAQLLKQEWCQYGNSAGGPAAGIFLWDNLFQSPLKQAQHTLTASHSGMKAAAWGEGVTYRQDTCARICMDVSATILLCLPCMAVEQRILAPAVMDPLLMLGVSSSRCVNLSFFSWMRSVSQRAQVAAPITQN